MKIVRLCCLGVLSIVLLSACSDDTDEFAPDQDTEPPVATIAP